VGRIDVDSLVHDPLTLPDLSAGHFSR